MKKRLHFGWEGHTGVYAVELNHDDDAYWCMSELLGLNACSKARCICESESREWMMSRSNVERLLESCSFLTVHAARGTDAAALRDEQERELI